MLVCKYAPEMLPGVNPADLKVAYWNGIKWEILTDTILDTEDHTLSVQIRHFSNYALLSPVIATNTTPLVPTTTTTTIASTLPEPVVTTTTAITTQVITPTPTQTPEEATTSVTPEIIATTTTPLEETTTIEPVTTTESTSVDVSVVRLNILVLAIGAAVLLILATAAFIALRRRKTIDNRIRFK
jgi:hypothetical protein